MGKKYILADIICWTIAIVQAVLIVLKIAGVITWSWLWVTSLIWIISGTSIIFIIAVLIYTTTIIANQICIQVKNGTNDAINEFVEATLEDMSIEKERN